MVGYRSRGRSGSSVRVRALLTVLLAAVPALGAAGCDDDPAPRGSGTTTSTATPGAVTLPAGTTQRRITVDGRDRGYRLYRPPRLMLERPVPLVVMLHGALGSGAQAERSYGWNAAADRDGFLVLYPDGVSRSWAVTDGCCGPPARDGVDDVGFVSQVVTGLAGELPIDPARIFVTGISNGGLLAYRLACATPHFAAVAVVAATMIGDCATAVPVSVLHIHGTSDRVMPYGGGPGRLDNDGTGRRPVRIDGPAVPAVIDHWRTVDRCAPAREVTRGHVTTSTASCPQGREVVLVSVAGAGHQWPGAAPGGDGLTSPEPPTSTLDATGVISAFFATHAKPS